MMRNNDYSYITFNAIQTTFLCHLLLFVETFYRLRWALQRSHMRAELHVIIFFFKDASFIRLVIRSKEETVLETLMHHLVTARLSETPFFLERYVPCHVRSAYFRLCRDDPTFGRSASRCTLVRSDMKTSHGDHGASREPEPPEKRKL